jgi:hypothetical protein
MWRKSLLLLIPLAAAHAADVCNPLHLQGPYVFQLSGSTTISGSPQPTVSLGRIVFDGSGKLSGTSSVTFSGILLGNPVTGTYEAKEDCSLTWQLQDDSGAYQHFRGKLSPDLSRAQFRQIDSGGTGGVLQKTSDSCTPADLRANYNFVLSGSTKELRPGQVAHSVAARGTVDTVRNGTFQVDTDCTVHFSLSLPPPNGPLPIQLRGFLVDDGKEILGFQTDPGAMVSARLTAVEHP